MTRVACILALMAAVSGLVAQDSGPYSEIRIYMTGSSEMQRLQAGGWQPDHLKKGKGYVDAVVNRDEFALLRSLGASMVVLVPDLKADYAARPAFSPDQSFELQQRMRATYGISGFGFGSMGGYYTFAEVVRQLDTMALLYPGLISVKDSIGASIEGRAIWAVRISDHPELNEDEPEVLYTGLHHAREPEGMMAVLYFMYYLLENYGVDEEVTHLVNEREMYFIPVVNPDGYVRNQTTNPGGGGMWRKNRRLNAGGSIGVDLNRNYGYMWGYDNNGSSPNPSSDTYRGTAAFSEPEIQVVRDFCLDHDFKLALNYHTYGNLLIYPWGYIASFQTPDSAVFDTYTTDMTEYNHYVHGTGDQTVGYVTNGDSDDWMYGEQIIKNKILSMTPEVGPSFWPPQDQIFPLAEENLHPNLYLAWAAGPFIRTEGMVFDAESYAPGDTGGVQVVVKSRGLMPASAVLHWSTESGLVTLLDSSAAVDLPAIIGSDTIQFRFVVDPDAIAPVALETVLRVDMSGSIVSTNRLPILVGDPIPIFTSDAENGLAGWTVTGAWNTTTTQFHSPTHSFTESPAGNYPANADVRLTMSAGLDFTQVAAAAVTYWDRYVTEADYDYCLVEISTDGGAAWTTLSKVSGSNLVWTEHWLDASTAAGGTQVKFRFRLTSDQSLQYDGWWVDDIVIKVYPREPVVGVKAGGMNDRSAILQQNHPNPFNPSTAVKYHLQSDGPVKLAIYNVLGQRVRILVDDVQTRGWQEVAWDGTDATGRRAASGIYIYRLEAGGRSVSRKMLLIK